MYGTICNLKVKDSHEGDPLEAMDERSGEIEGAVAWLLMRRDDENADLVGVAVFESKSDYVANANSPGQHEALTKMMEHLECEPSWTDGEYIQTVMSWLYMVASASADHNFATPVVRVIDCDGGAVNCYVERLAIHRD